MARLGPYELLRQVGTGGMGQVWLGRRTMIGGATKTFAIKLLAARHVSSDRHQEMFLEEARLSMALEHSNIVKVHEVGESEGTWYMAMEWLDGLTLAQLNAALRERKQPVPWGVIGFIIGQVLRALAYAHEADHRGTKQPVVHRDVSPQNVMLTVTGDVKLLDFGIARFVSDESSGLYVKGKPRYMSSEQFYGLSREPIIDLFAVGALLHELLDGGRIFRWQAGDKQLLEVVGAGKIPDLAADARVAPLELDELRRDLLAPQDRRLPSARVALARISAWSGYRDASLELQELVRTLVPAIPDEPEPEPEPAASPVVDDLFGSLDRLANTPVGAFNDTLAIGKTDASIDMGSRNPASRNVGPRDPAPREAKETADALAMDAMFALAEEALVDDEQETRPRPGSKPRLPVPPPPPVIPERELEIDWMEIGRDSPKTGPHPAVSVQSTKGGSPVPMFVLIAVIVVLGLLGAAKLLL